MKGVVLAGGTGSRLWPVTIVTSKQLLPLYDKPMIYYPISTLMLAGIREILVITTEADALAFKKLLGDGSRFGVHFHYAVQIRPEGLAQALIIAEEFLAGDLCLMILGDNVFHGVGLGHDLRRTLPTSGAHIFTYTVSNPSQYGILSLSEIGQPLSIVEKPTLSESNLAVTGLYFFDARASEIAKQVTPSERGELEITSVIQKYLQERQLTHTHLSRGTAWLDTGTPGAMHDASTYIRVLEDRTGLKIACLEEIALSHGWITYEEIQNQISKVDNDYNKYLSQLPQKEMKN